jgi:hypothetical protein
VHRIVLIGSGSLSRSIAYSLAVSDIGEPLSVVVIARRTAPATELCEIANLRATAAGTPVRFGPLIQDITRSAFLKSLHATPPLGVVLCASHQSPWERSINPSAWTRMLRVAGYGLSLPLQADLAISTGRAAADCGAWFINACLPDMVNPLLAALNIPVRCGIGNVSTLATALQYALGLTDQRKLALLAHHLHLHTPAEDDDEARAWQNGNPVNDVGGLLAAMRGLGRAELNQVTGYTGAQVVSAMVTGQTLDTSLPGPLGLPGGYPVRLHKSEVTLRLPAHVSLPEAIAANERWSLADGAVVKGDGVLFSPACSAALAIELPELSAGFAVTETAKACRLLLELRTRLRAHPGGKS